MANNNVDEQVYSHIIILPYQWLHFLHTSKHSYVHRTCSIRWCSQAHIITQCRHRTFTVPLGTLLKGVAHSTHMCVFVCLKHVYPIFNALLSHCWFVPATPTTKLVSIVSNAIFVILIKTIYRSKNFNPMLLNGCLLPISLFRSPYSQSTSCHSPFLFVWISFVTFAIWSKFINHIRKNKQWHTHKQHLQLT